MPEKSIDELLYEKILEGKHAITEAIIARAKAGEPSAMKAVERVITEASLEAEKNKFPLTDDQYKRLILVAAKRIMGQLAT